jgi:KaiC/GvpD/RAD55 family RecA-like ATPase
MTDGIKNSLPVTGQVKIPKELVQFLRQETYSLLIKGFSGTGKTTLALCILKELNINKNSLYISTRVSPDQLFQYFSWMKRFFIHSKKTDLVEASENVTDHSMFVDGRLDETTSLFERITNELMDVKAPTIIIDTWDTVGFSMDKESLTNNVKVLQTWRERAGAKIIFVTEVVEDKTFDSLVDGIVELRQKQLNERLIREIILSKLRGVRINKSSYIFSVNNSLFHSYDHYNPSEFLDSVYFPSSKGINRDLFKNKSHFTTGYHELDEILGGGFPLGWAVGIELYPHVNAKIAFAFLSKIIVNFIANQNSLLFQPFEKTGSDIIIQYTKSFGSQKDLIEIIPAKSKTPTIPKINTDRQPSQIQQTIQKIKERHQKKMLLTILGPETVNLFSKTDSNTDGLESLSFIKSNSNLSIFISRHLQDNRHTNLSEISDIRLSILEIDGTIFLQSEIPRSHLFAIVAPSDKGQGIKLEPIV